MSSKAIRQEAAVYETTPGIKLSFSGKADLSTLLSPRLRHATTEIDFTRLLNPRLNTNLDVTSAAFPILKRVVDKPLLANHPEEALAYRPSMSVNDAFHGGLDQQLLSFVSTSGIHQNPHTALLNWNALPMSVTLELWWLVELRSRPEPTSKSTIVSLCTPAILAGTNGIQEFVIERHGGMWTVVSRESKKGNFKITTDKDGQAFYT